MRALLGIGVAVGLILIAFEIGRWSTIFEAHPSDLTTRDLSDVLSLYWWTVNIPTDLKPKDMVGVELISSDGKTLEGGGGFSPTTEPIGSTMRVYCWEDKGSHQMNVMLKTEKGDVATTYFTDYFKGAANGGYANGTVLNVGDILLKFDPSKTPSLSGSDELSDGQIGLRVVVTRK